MADRQEPTISQTGVWVDTTTGRVVESEPEEGKLIVPPGGEVDQRVLDDIAAAKVAAGQTDAESVTDASDETDEDDSDEDKPRRGRGRTKATADVPDLTEKATE